MGIQGSLTRKTVISRLKADIWIEYLPSKREALGSTPSTTKKKKKKRALLWLTEC
jgi:hypothetical protein